MKSLPNTITLSPEQLELVMDMAACNYSPELIAKQLNIPEDAFMRLWGNADSDLRQAFEAGRLKATFNIMNKQRELAESGNITAAQIFLKESEKVGAEAIRDKILYDGWS